MANLNNYHVAERLAFRQQTDGTIVFTEDRALRNGDSLLLHWTDENSYDLAYAEILRQNEPPPKS